MISLNSPSNALFWERMGVDLGFSDTIMCFGGLANDLVKERFYF